MHNHWTAQEWMGLLGSVGTLVTVMTTATIKILAAIHGIHHDVNSLKDELVAETRRSATAEGLAAGRKEGRRQEQERNLHGQEMPDLSDGEKLAGTHGYGP